MDNKAVKQQHPCAQEPLASLPGPQDVLLALRRFPGPSLHELGKGFLLRNTMKV